VIVTIIIIVIIIIIIIISRVPIHMAWWVLPDTTANEPAPGLRIKQYRTLSALS
jgi:hypothetical protein